MTILIRRFSIICLTFTVFALVMVMAVNSSARHPAFGGVGLGAPCPQPLDIHCAVRN